MTGRGILTSRKLETLLEGRPWVRERQDNRYALERLI